MPNKDSANLSECEHTTLADCRCVDDELDEPEIESKPRPTGLRRESAGDIGIDGWADIDSWIKKKDTVSWGPCYINEDGSSDPYTATNG